MPHFAAGHIAPLVSKVYPLEQAAEAHRAMEAGEHFGKLVLRVQQALTQRLIADGPRCGTLAQWSSRPRLPSWRRTTNRWRKSFSSRTSAITNSCCCGACKAFGGGWSARPPNGAT
ncbi:MAG TPA: zinc-binding dehydrogenase [Gammaproteobacteria bacterium]|nr:zinc-binding dehydrogenase [Gammaproteobacteria bacterium]